jgi:Co/Zn/Cd efflux system component
MKILILFHQYFIQQYVTSLLIFLLQPEWKMADPICTFVFSVIVLITTFTILRDILVVLMEGLSIYISLFYTISLIETCNEPRWLSG